MSFKRPLKMVLKARLKTSKNSLDHTTNVLYKLRNIIYYAHA